MHISPPNNTCKKILINLCFFLSSSLVYTQGLGIAAVPVASAILNIGATNKGVLLPRVSLNSNTDALTIKNPATHLIVYNINESKLSGLTGKGLYRNSNNEASPNWQSVATNEKGITGEPGQPGPKGNTGTKSIIKSGAIAGFLGASIPGNAAGYVFAGQTTSITITAGQKIIVWGEVPIGLATGLPSQKVNLGAGYQLAAGGVIKNMTVNYVTVFVGPERFSQAIAGVISPGAGTWIIGAVIENVGSAPLTNNEYGNLIYMVLD
ncbi:MAG: hypothetical protein V4717_19735 [Bacteroidota bacterium]